MASLDVPAVGQAGKHLQTQSRKRHKKGKLIKQGYSKFEKDDARRVAARTFLSGIPLDSNHLSVSPASGVSHRVQEMHSLALQRQPSSVSRHSHTLQIDGINPPLAPTDHAPDRLHDMSIESPVKQVHVHQKQSPVRQSQSFVRDLESPAHELVFPKPYALLLADAVDTGEKQLDGHARRQLFWNETTCVLHASTDLNQLSLAAVLDRRYVCSHI